MSEFYQCGEGGCVLQHGHPGEHAHVRYAGSSATAARPWAPPLTHAERQRMEAEIDTLRARAEKAEAENVTLREKLHAHAISGTTATAIIARAEQVERDFAEARDLIAEAQARQEQAEREVAFWKHHGEEAWKDHDALKSSVLALAEEWATYKGNFHPENVAYQQGRHDCAIALREAVEGK